MNLSTTGNRKNQTKENLVTAILSNFPGHRFLIHGKKYKM